MGQLKDAEVLLVRSKTKVTREFLANAPNLKLVIRAASGSTTSTSRPAASGAST